MLSLLDTQTLPTINHSPTFHYSKIIGQQGPTTDQLIHTLINCHNDTNVSYISPFHTQVVSDNSLTHLDMPQRTPTHTSPFHQQITNNTGSSTSSANGNHNNNASTGGGKGAFTQSTTTNANNMSNTLHVQPNNMLDSINQGPKNMFLFHQSSSNSSEMNSTCNNSITTPTNNTSLHFHNMNNQIVGNSSNKKRKHENVGASSSATTTENAIFYHMETDFKRKHADKKRLVWTNDLHELFVKAVDQLGLQEARPKEILELMNLPDLTTTHIKSHLQKYRQQVKKGIIPTAGGSSFGSELGASDSETSEGVNEDVKQEQITSVANGTTMSNNMSSGNQNSIYNHHSNQSSSIPTIPNAQSSSQNFSSLNNSDQVNYIKNFLLHFNQIGSGANLRPNNNDESTSGNNSSYGSSSSYQRPQLQQVTFANSITNNNITTVNQPLFQLGDGRSILQNCHLLTSANSLSEFLVLLQEICQTESDMGAIFNSLPVRSSNDLNLIVEGFRIGFICGMKFKPSQ